GLERMGIDEHGLTRVDRLILASMARAAGTPVGLKTLSAAVGEDERTLEDVYEPHLLREGFVVKTPQGRRLTRRGADVVRANDLAPPPAASQGDLPL
ncbi:MAG: Holliday junction DNA helicase RuvB C-terminal domain-containing protein, partial [Planctomycetota bacterium]